MESGNWGVGGGGNIQIVESSKWVKIGVKWNFGDTIVDSAIWTRSDIKLVFSFLRKRIRAAPCFFIFYLSTLILEKSTLILEKSTLILKKNRLSKLEKSTLNLKKSTLNLEKSTLILEKSTLILAKSTLNLEKSTSILKKSTLNFKI